MAATSQNRIKFEDYDGFVNKFKPKLTTDDCYTPPAVYDCILGWVKEKIDPLTGMTIRRPFKPGGDYQAEAAEYTDRDVVVDNPPFSILAKIIDFYIANKIKFFLFAPALTLFAAPRNGVTYIAAHCDVIYENGATVRTSFVTNMEGKHRIMVAGDLFKRVKEVTERTKKRVVRKKIYYPNEVVTSAILGHVAVRGICFNVGFDECAFVRKLDNQQGALFGSGYILSERAAAERAAAERAAAERAAAEGVAAEGVAAERVELSDRELAIIAHLSKF